MERALASQVREIKERVKSDHIRMDETFKVGVEIEGCLLDNKGKPVNASPLIEEMKSTKFPLDYEYGLCQFEFKTSPVSMEDLLSLNGEFEEFIETLARTVDKVYKENEVIPVFLGANPSPFVIAEGLITPKDRYLRLAKWQQNIPDVEIDGQSFKALHVAAAIQGFHLHLQGKNPDFTARMFNYILNLIPSSIMIGANSRLFAGKVFSLHEPRIFLYDQSEQQNSGFPSIPRYLAGVEDYIDYVTSRKAAIAKDYFELVKERHDDARIRINTGLYRVETRVMSVQPTPKSLMAMTEFFIGFLHGAIQENFQLRPLSSLREERIAVVRSGFDAKANFNVKQTVSNQLSIARKGLQDLGIKAEFLDILDKRLENHTTAGEYVAKAWMTNFNGNIQKTLYEIISDIWQHTRANKPLT